MKSNNAQSIPTLKPVKAPSSCENEIREQAMKIKQNQKRKSLIKFSAVIAVLAILTLILLPKFNSIVEEQRQYVAEILKNEEAEKPIKVDGDSSAAPPKY